MHEHDTTCNYTLNLKDSNDIFYEVKENRLKFIVSKYFFNLLFFVYKNWK